MNQDTVVDRRWSDAEMTAYPKDIDPKIRWSGAEMTSYPKDIDPGIDIKEVKTKEEALEDALKPDMRSTLYPKADVKEIKTEEEEPEDALKPDMRSTLLMIPITGLLVAAILLEWFEKAGDYTLSLWELTGDELAIAKGLTSDVVSLRDWCDGNAYLPSSAAVHRVVEMGEKDNFCTEVMWARIILIASAACSFLAIICDSISHAVVLLRPDHESTPQVSGWASFSGTWLLALTQALSLLGISIFWTAKNSFENCCHFRMNDNGNSDGLDPALGCWLAIAGYVVAVSAAVITYFTLWRTFKHELEEWWSTRKSDDQKKSDDHFAPKGIPIPEKRDCVECDEEPKPRASWPTCLT